MNPTQVMYSNDMGSSFGLVANRQRKSPEDFSRGLRWGVMLQAKCRIALCVMQIVCGCIEPDQFNGITLSAMLGFALHRKFLVNHR
jgi:hypothetical protein